MFTDTITLAHWQFFLALISCGILSEVFTWLLGKLFRRKGDEIEGIDFGFQGSESEHEEA